MLGSATDATLWRPAGIGHMHTHTHTHTHIQVLVFSDHSELVIHSALVIHSSAELFKWGSHGKLGLGR